MRESSCLCAFVAINKGMGKSQRKPFRNIGHRGAAGHAPENTMSSFYKALELGADTIEMGMYTFRKMER